ncbi:MAG: tRNA (cytidine(34)-2'-O)-methyltransferase [Gammaproteobacteria bacterium]|nr:tRNA (cytidine(34)-2'-O)-methyltransferase [Gammaproteobacteria bacterium]
MFLVALFEPEIPPNTGNIIRLCANTGCTLHLIGRLGFDMDEKQLRRAGLDYHQYTEVRTWGNWDSFRRENPARIISFSTRNHRCYSDFRFSAGDILLFGSETSGLPEWLREQTEEGNRLTIPMRQNSRSLNLSNSAAIAVYEAWRQNAFRNRSL